MRLGKLRRLGRPINPRDLRNPKRKSGYDYVNNGKGGSKPNSANTNWRQTWRAAQGTKGIGTSSAGDWRGPVRDTPVEAAQDFCDHFNGHPTQSVHATLTTPGHEYIIDEFDRDPEYEAALGVVRDRTAQRNADIPGYVYLIRETESSPGRSNGGALNICKMGKSTNPRRRLAEVQANNPRILELVYVKYHPNYEAEEKRLHRKHVGCNIIHEWFRPTKELLLEFKPEDRHTKDRPYTETEKARARQREAA